MHHRDNLARIHPHSQHWRQGSGAGESLQLFRQNPTLYASAVQCRKGRGHDDVGIVRWIFGACCMPFEDGKGLSGEDEESKEDAQQLDRYRLSMP